MPRFKTLQMAVDSVAPPIKDIGDMCARLNNHFSGFPDGQFQKNMINVTEPLFRLLLTRRRQLTAPLLVGMSAPQGFGKTTIAGALSFLFRSNGMKFVTLSIDDFYYPHEKMEEVQQQFAQNRLLQGRGLPGTHDIGLAVKTLQQLRKPDSQTVLLPRYDKAAIGGGGDRMAEGLQVECPIDVVLFDGWFLAFEPVAIDSSSLKLTPDLQDINRILVQYRPLQQLFNDWIVVHPQDPKVVYQWRQEQELSLLKEGRGGMPDGEVKRFVDRFIPAYNLFQPGVKKRCLELSENIELDHDDVFKGSGGLFLEVNGSREGVDVALWGSAFA